MRSSLKRLHNAVTHIATVSRLSPDPPPVHPYRQFTVVSEFAIVVGDGVAELVTYNAPPSDHVISLTFKTEKPADFKLNSGDLVLAFQNSFGFDTTKTRDNWQVGLIRAAIWGPLPQQVAASVELYVSSGGTTRTSVDHGSPTSRPKAGLGIPNLHWVGTESIKGADAIQFRIVPHNAGDVGGKTGTIIGIMQLTLAGRLKGLPSKRAARTGKHAPS